MTQNISSLDLKKRLEIAIPDSIIETGDDYLLVNTTLLADICQLLKEDKELDLDYLSNLTATDYKEYYEVIYRLVSLGKNHSITLKARLNKKKLTIPSVFHIWRGADLQEREVYDLMGITFSSHPNLKRILLWEGFEGHPLRKDYSLDA